MKKPWIASLISLVVLVAIAGFARATLYQNHLSGDVRRLLLAANDSNESAEEIESYIHQARPLLRTAKDRKLLEKFERGVDLVRDASRASNQRFESTMNEISQQTATLGLHHGHALTECDQEFYRLIDLDDEYNQKGLKSPADIGARIHAARLDATRCGDRKKLERQQAERLSEDQMRQGIRLINDVRPEVGLAPLPSGN